MRTCCCWELLRVHESHRNTPPAFTHTHTQCQSECRLEMCPPFNQALTSRIDTAQKEGGGVCTVHAAGVTGLTETLYQSVWLSSPTATRHTDGCSVLTPVLPPDTHHTLSEPHWGCDVWGGFISLINENIVTVLTLTHGKEKPTAWPYKKGEGGSSCRCNCFRLTGDHMFSWRLQAEMHQHICHLISTQMNNTWGDSYAVFVLWSRTFVSGISQEKHTCFLLWADCFIGSGARVGLQDTRQQQQLQWSLCKSQCTVPQMQNQNLHSRSVLLCGIDYIFSKFSKPKEN